MAPTSTPPATASTTPSANHARLATGSIGVLAGPYCPRHGVGLSGGPVVWHCPDGHPYGHRVQAADLNRERQPHDAGAAA